MPFTPFHMGGARNTGKGNIIGATLLAVFSALSGKYLSGTGLKILGVSKQRNPIKIRWWVSFLSAFTGTYSHVILDSIMHSDVEPYYPLSKENGLLALINVNQLHQLCIYSALVGAIIYYSVQYARKKT